MGKATMRSSTNSVSSTLNENSYENHLSMESRMREICTSGLTRGRTSAVIGNASHPVAFSLLYSKKLVFVFFVLFVVKSPGHTEPTEPFRVFRVFRSGNAQSCGGLVQLQPILGSVP